MATQPWRTERHGNALCILFASEDVRDEAVIAAEKSVTLEALGAGAVKLDQMGCFRVESGPDAPTGLAPIGGLPLVRLSDEFRVIRLQESSWKKVEAARDAELEQRRPLALEGGEAELVALPWGTVMGIDELDTVFTSVDKPVDPAALSINLWIDAVTGDAFRPKVDGVSAQSAFMVVPGLVSYQTTLQPIAPLGLQRLLLPVSLPIKDRKFVDVARRRELARIALLKHPVVLTTMGTFLRRLAKVDCREAAAYPCLSQNTWGSEGFFSMHDDPNPTRLDVDTLEGDVLVMRSIASLESLAEMMRKEAQRGADLGYYPGAPKLIAGRPVGVSDAVFLTLIDGP